MARRQGPRARGLFANLLCGCSPRRRPSRAGRDPRGPPAGECAWRRAPRGSLPRVVAHAASAAQVPDWRRRARGAGVAALRHRDAAVAAAVAAARILRAALRTAQTRQALGLSAAAVAAALLAASAAAHAQATPVLLRKSRIRALTTRRARQSRGAMSPPLWPWLRVCDPRGGGAAAVPARACRVRAGRSAARAAAADAR
mmetsp:Transcript_3911/g.8299  ORF Transcript_3911/g.8299 Transcript_3911/m.8299 type:complete len:200 (-) Transcript_3911:440-1039(-)